MPWPGVRRNWKPPLRIVQQVTLDRWNPLRLNKKIATHFGLTINQVRHIRSKPVFQTEYKRQLAIYQQSFDEIQLADRKERVLAMQELYEKILAQIRAEVDFFTRSNSCNFG